jgi:hypothetical protein
VGNAGDTTEQSRHNDGFSCEMCLIGSGGSVVFITWRWSDMHVCFVCVYNVIRVIYLFLYAMIK